MVKENGRLIGADCGRHKGVVRARVYEIGEISASDKAIAEAATVDHTPVYGAHMSHDAKKQAVGEDLRRTSLGEDVINKLLDHVDGRNMRLVRFRNHGPHIAMVEHPENPDGTHIIWVAPL